MSILLSVNPPYSLAICLGFKRIEWRKKPLPKGRVFIYETKRLGGSGMVIGQAEIIDTISVYPSVEFPDKMLINCCMGAREVLQRYAGVKEIFANTLSNSFAYGEPVPLSEFYKPCKLDDGGRSFSGCGRCEHSVYAPDMQLVCDNRFSRPPQSWCYCEDLKGETVTEEGSKSK